MCWLMKKLRPTLMPIAFFRCAPTASIGATGAGSRTGSGAYPRARRSIISRPSTTWTIESSTCLTMGRLWTRSRSAMPRSRSSASRSSMQIGSSVRLPLVATTGRPMSRMSR